MKDNRSSYNAADAITLVNDGLSLFISAQYQINNHTVEEIIDWLPYASTILNLVLYSDDYSKSIATNMLWYRDTATVMLVTEILKISHVSMWMPKVTPSSEVADQLEAKLLAMAAAIGAISGTTYKTTGGRGILSSRSGKSYLTCRQINKINKAKLNNTGCDIKLSKTQVVKNGGFIGALLAGILPAVISGIAGRGVTLPGTISKKIKDYKK
ncbi:hypothetical protein TrispH2_009828 [Trichoplax sp. H2]|nr:hypothetical protein TrispH2_009828 [Trichoplax sp. H2]|eukprot:RDD38198.1 hypothetical protein TrispH2_009828 [Trichoplax sp. H2]